MPKNSIVASLMGAAWAVWAMSAHAQTPGEPPQAQLQEPTLTPSLSPSTPAAEDQSAPEALPAASEATAPVDQPPMAAAPAEPADPVVAIIRVKLADPAIGKSENADDLAALSAFYGARTAGPLWITEMGFSAKGQQALFKSGKPAIGGSTPLRSICRRRRAADGAEAQALAEIKLDLAILKYARTHAVAGSPRRRSANCSTRRRPCATRTRCSLRSK